MPVYLSGALVPKNNGTFSLLDEKYIRGGFRVLNTTAELQTLDASLYKVGMIALVLSEQDDQGNPVGATFKYTGLDGSTRLWERHPLGLRGFKGDAFKYSDFTPDQLAALKGNPGKDFKYEDFTPAQLEALKVKGDAFRFEDFTQAQLDSLKVKGDDGKRGDPGPAGNSFRNRGNWTSGMQLRPNDYVFTQNPDNASQTTLWIYVGSADPYTSTLLPHVDDAANWGRFDNLQGPTGAAGDPRLVTFNFPYDLQFFSVSNAAAGSVIGQYIVPRPLNLKAAFAHSAKATVGVTTTGVFAIKVNGMQLGTCTFTSAGVQFALQDRTLAAGDLVTCVVQTADATLAGVSINIVTTATVQHIDG